MLPGITPTNVPMNCPTCVRARTVCAFAIRGQSALCQVAGSLAIASHLSISFALVIASSGAAWWSTLSRCTLFPRNRATALLDRNRSTELRPVAVVGTKNAALQCLQKYALVSASGRRHFVQYIVFELFPVFAQRCVKCGSCDALSATCLLYTSPSPRDRG